MRYLYHLLGSSQRRISACMHACIYSDWVLQEVPPGPSFIVVASQESITETGSHKLIQHNPG